jgi:hypothetical protein
VTVALTLRVPTLALTQTIDLRCGPIAWDDGRPFTLAQVQAATFTMYRQDSSGVLAWDDQAKTWISGTPTQPEALYPFQPRKTPNIWAATLMAIGQKDSSQNDKFSSASAVYFVTCQFAAVDADKVPWTATSPPSTALAIVPQGPATASASVLVDPEPPDQANSITLFIGQPPQLSLKLSRSPVLFAELSAAGASVRIDASGGITLAPAAGQPLTIDAPAGLYVNGVRVGP